ncbi:MAG: hypothetical protein Q4Q07_10920, partial [Tissierellia bacterium]|nr:hypothetical protein [Tissierellia bacterium]
MKRKFELIKILALLMIVCTISLTFRSPESKYKELNKKIPTINQEEVTRKDKDFNVLFSSKDCF